MEQLLGEPVRFYREVVRAAAVSADMRAFHLDQFRRFVAQHSLNGHKVLEVGCGGGDYLALLRDAGMTRAGSSTPSARSRSAGPTTCQRIAALSTVRAGRAVCGLLHPELLEPLLRPRQALRGIAANFEPGAVGMVEVPNFDMIVKDGLFFEFIADHLIYFTEATLRQTLSLSGFDVLECAPVWHDYILSATVRKRDATDLNHLDTHRRTIGQEVAAFLDRFTPGQVAIWGTGHRSP